jgi:hypothetical protein
LRRGEERQREVKVGIVRREEKEESRTREESERGSNGKE